MVSYYHAAFLYYFAKLQVFFEKHYNNSLFLEENVADKASISLDFIQAA